MEDSNYLITVLEKDAFSKLIEELSKNEEQQHKLLGIINDFTEDKDLVYNYTIKQNNDITCKYINDIYFLKWDNPKYFRLLKNLITVIINKNITQRVCIIDRNYIKLYDNTLLEDEYKDIPMPSMICEFNDKETIRLLKQIDNGGNYNGL